MTQLDGITEVLWVDDLLPEFLWIGLMIRAHGLPRAFRILEALVDAGPKGGPADSGWFSRASTYAGLDREARLTLVRTLEESGHLADLKAGVAPLVAHYPSCPLSFLFTEDPPEGELATVRGAVAESLNRWSEGATWIQIGAVYTLVGQGKLLFPKDSIFADFPEVERYPETEKSRMIASSCRALINSYPPSERSEASREWTRYFWARGLELEPCVPIDALDDDE